MAKDNDVLGNALSVVKNPAFAGFWKGFRQDSDSNDIVDMMELDVSIQPPREYLEFSTKRNVSGVFNFLARFVGNTG